MTKEEIRNLVEAYIKDTELFLVDVKLSPSRLAVFVDKATGVTLDECSALTRHLLNTLESTTFLESHEIEVSSPGMDMPLVVPRQYLRRIGREVSVITNDGSVLKGMLQSANEKGFELLAVTEKKENKKKIRTEELLNFTYDTIRETKLIINYKFK